MRSSSVLLLALSLLGALYAGVAGPSAAQEEEEPTSLSMEIEEGRDLYLTGCSTCHGLQLQGGAGGPALVGVGASSVWFQVESGRMPLYAGVQQAPRKTPRYSIDEIDAMAKYIQVAGGGGPTLPPGDLTDGDLQLGGALFRNNCASCHNFAGSGGALTYGKYAPALDVSSPRVIYAAMQTGPESMPRYGDAQLLPEEKRAITRYVRYITESENVGGAGLGRYGPTAEGLLAWVLGITVMVALTLWIGARS